MTSSIFSELETLQELKNRVLEALAGRAAGMTLSQLSREVGVRFNELGLRFALNELIAENRIEKRLFGLTPRYALLSEEAEQTAEKRPW